jgi:DNA-binding CsgD family transcriptional regulator
MNGSMAFDLRVMREPDRLDAHGLRSLLLATLARRGEGVFVCTEALEILFLCPRATKLLDRLGGSFHRIPSELCEVIDELRRSSCRSLSRTVSRLQVHVCELPEIGYAVWLREEVRRDEELFTALNERFGLRRRAFQVALLVRQGLSNREIARELRLEQSTVKVYLHHVYQTCGVRSRTTLIALMDSFRRNE